jgi:hypothetical protein
MTLGPHLAAGERMALLHSVCSVVVTCGAASYCLIRMIRRVTVVYSRRTTSVVDIVPEGPIGTIDCALQGSISYSNFV